ncbi:cyclic nucleotide-binding domain-containing protein [Desulforhopalus singaporensis]|uniref:cAMP-binding domain of CRP or a regulatory subunit of cAMP-dependent protein kinases n=1 Tax=Desulforhopalus singaporensis TaxID=91360 RepID=A0A1H0PCB2_9BACT|nr:cyclic nucleotide-binding domain-containing protein [Desulforhopalus singaporensis]SDP02747.1 cAMP-binding domain of CRP or a regulatory subunit of cAMP-dependent protein kinases [Desulforhopalus singaporensis]
MIIKNGGFVITEENQCPLYHAGEEFEVKEGALNLPVGKPTCLVLTRDVLEILTQEDDTGTPSRPGSDKTKFECGGCRGLIRFELKKERRYATLQMKLLAAADRHQKTVEASPYSTMLRKVSMFATLSDEELIDLAILLDFKEFQQNVEIVRKGEPGNRLFVVLSGKAEVVDEKGVSLAELHQGDVFGEMSLLSGERVSSTVVALEKCRIAVMSQKNFRHILRRFSTLQVFLYKLLIGRIEKINKLRAEEISSDLVGQLSDISTVELCQMINVNQKTGKILINHNHQIGRLLFNEGEVVHAEIGGLTGVEAFYRLIAIDRGRFRYVQGLNDQEKNLDILGGFMGMIMEGMKRIDDGEYE